jgi:hypothetical protein
MMTVASNRWGLETSYLSGLSAPRALLFRMVEEAHVYVQGVSLKTCATFLR